MRFLHQRGYEKSWLEVAVDRAHWSQLTQVWVQWRMDDVRIRPPCSATEAASLRSLTVLELGDGTGACPVPWAGTNNTSVKPSWVTSEESSDDGCVGVYDGFTVFARDLDAAAEWERDGFFSDDSWEPETSDSLQSPLPVSRVSSQSATSSTSDSDSSYSVSSSSSDSSISMLLLQGHTSGLTLSVQLLSGA